MSTIEQTIDRNINRIILCCNGCWEWQGKAWSGPYGQLTHNHKTYYAHRFFYEYFNTEIPEGLELDHLCKNTWCINPDHLEPVTQEINIARSSGITALNMRKTVCKRGHSFNYTYQGKRICRTCRTELQKERRLLRK